MDDIESNSLGILKNISKKLSLKGQYFWFDKDGKLISYDKIQKNAKTKFLKKSKDKLDEKFVNICISINKKDVMDEETGGLELFITVERIIERNEKYGTELYKKDTLMRLFYSYDELKKFKLKDLHNIAKYVGNKRKYKPLKYYHYSDIQKYII